LGGLIVLAAVVLAGCNDSGGMSFNERVSIGIGIVAEQYPEARLYEAQGDATAGPTTDPDAIDHVRLVFQNVDNTTVVIDELSPGVFGAPKLEPFPWLEDVVIDWPVKMDLPEAVRLKEQAGNAVPFQHIVLRQPIFPGLIHPYFIFDSPKGWYIFVDTVSGRVDVTF
jgi:hypothetical protein